MFKQRDRADEASQFDSRSNHVVALGWFLQFTRAALVEKRDVRCGACERRQP